MVDRRVIQHHPLLGLPMAEQQLQYRTTRKPKGRVQAAVRHLGQQCQGHAWTPPSRLQEPQGFVFIRPGQSHLPVQHTSWLSMCFTPQDLTGHVAYLRVSDFTNPPIVPGSQHLTLAGSCTRECAYTVNPQGGCQLSLA